MTVGLGLTIAYMLLNAPAFRSALKLSGSGLWFGIQPVSAGVFGVFAGVAVILVLTLLSRRPRGI
jgi:cation/acetate symporter